MDLEDSAVFISNFIIADFVVFAFIVNYLLEYKKIPGI